ncbi:hypothetical protein D3C84_610260 [compost metagenome]
MASRAWEGFDPASRCAESARSNGHRIDQTIHVVFAVGADSKQHTIPRAVFDSTGSAQEGVGFVVAVQHFAKLATADDDDAAAKELGMRSEDFAGFKAEWKDLRGMHNSHHLSVSANRCCDRAIRGVSHTLVD